MNISHLKCHFCKFSEVCKINTKRLQQIEVGLNAYTVSFDDSFLNPLREVFDASLRERLGR